MLCVAATAALLAGTDGRRGRQRGKEGCRRREPVAAKKGVWAPMSDGGRRHREPATARLLRRRCEEGGADRQPLLLHSRHPPLTPTPAEVVADQPLPPPPSSSRRGPPLPVPNPCSRRIEEARRLPNLAGESRRRAARERPAGERSREIGIFLLF